MVLDNQLRNYCIKETQTVGEAESIGYVITEMSKNRFRRLPVINEYGRPVGMVTSSDILTLLHHSGNQNFLKQSVAEIMSDRIIIADASDTVRDTIKLMYNIGISGIPVVENDRIVGMFTEKDILLIDGIWKEIDDVTITIDKGPGRPITDDTIVTTGFTFWQIADKFMTLAQRQLLVKNTDENSYVGIVTIMTLLQALVNSITFTNPNFDILQSMSIPEMVLKPLFQRALPVQLTSARLWMNSRGTEAFPIFHRGRPVKLITEKDLIGYAANHI